MLVLVFAVTVMLGSYPYAVVDIDSLSLKPCNELMDRVDVD